MDMNLMAGVALYCEQKYGVEITVKDLLWFAGGKTFSQFEEYLKLVYVVGTNPTKQGVKVVE